MYSLEKPNFCQKCGKSFGDAIAHDQAEGDESPVENIPQLDGLDVEIEGWKGNTTDIANIAGTRDANHPIDPGTSSPPPKTSSKDETLQEFMKEAGTLRKK
jgi:hypothetical protein